MNRNEALTYLKELISSCSYMSPSAVSFEEHKTEDRTNVSVHIRGGIGDVEKEIVRDLAKKHSLQVKDTLDDLVVFNPT
jgi:hypothetical protein